MRGGTMLLEKVDAAATLREPSTRQMAPEIVREGLRVAILSGEFAPGSQLRQDELAARFGTSRIPVREALRQLETEGLVTLQPNRGAIVASLSVQEVLELLDIRIALECRALKLAIPNMVDDDLDAAEAILDRYDAEPEAEGWSEMNWRFHEALYAPCDRPKLLAMIVSNYGHIDRFARIQVSLTVGKENPQEEHRRLLQLCRQGSVEPCVRLLEQHIGATQKKLASNARRTRRTV
jgi:DNA-binding GntR family transcriptional regulator